MTRPLAAALIGVPVPAPMSMPGCRLPQRIPYGLVIGPETGQISPADEGGDDVDDDAGELIALVIAVFAWRMALASASHSSSLSRVPARVFRRWSRTAARLRLSASRLSR